MACGVEGCKNDFMKTQRISTRELRGSPLWYYASIPHQLLPKACIVALPFASYLGAANSKASLLLFGCHCDFDEDLLERCLRDAPFSHTVASFLTLYRVEKLRNIDTVHREYKRLLSAQPKYSDNTAKQNLDWARSDTK